MVIIITTQQSLIQTQPAIIDKHTNKTVSRLLITCLLSNNHTGLEISIN